MLKQNCKLIKDLFKYLSKDMKNKITSHKIMNRYFDKGNESD